MKRFIIEVLTMQQDYLWFLASLALGAALVLVVRPVAERGARPWAGWVLGGYLAMALAELVRLAQIVRPPEMGEPNLELDLLHGAILAVQVWGVWKPAGHRAFLLLLLGEALVLASLRLPYPWSVTSLLCTAATAGLLWRARCEPDARGRKLAWALVPGLWLSPIGPATTGLGNWLSMRWWPDFVAGSPREEGITALTCGLRRWETTGPWGVWTAVALLATGAGALWVLSRDRWTERERQELRRYLPWMGLWLAIGLALAAGLGWRMRREYESDQKTKASLAAKLLPPAELARAFGPGFNPQWKPNRKGRMRAELSKAFQEQILPLRQQLSLVQRDLPADAYAMVMVQRNGYRTVAATATTFAKQSDHIAAQPSEPDFEPEAREIRFRPPYADSYGIVTQARVSLHAPDGGFIGWLVLESGVGEWLARQTQVRLQSFTMVGLGLGLVVLGLRQRLRNLARDEALREAEVARQASQAKSQFLARVSHELRTPIQSVLGNCELLQPAVPAGPARARLDALRQHGQLMARLVEDLLDLGAMQTGRFQLTPKPTRVTDLVHQTVESMRPRAEAKGLAYRIVLSGPSDEWRLADSERVRQVVLNLVANAIKFTDEGSIEVAFGREQPDELVLRVTDTGPGIPAAAAAKLFQPFTRLENTAAKEGTGLGLVLARGLCESMGGGVTLEPQAQGACFVARFRLPVTAAPRESAPPAMNSLRGRTILVVDDNTLIRELFSTYLQELGADCAVAADGAAALACTADRAYDVIVLDLALPGMSGIEVARRLRAAGAPGPRIVGVSAHASAEDRAQALAAGMNAFLTKPVNLHALADAIEARPRPADEAPTPALAGLQERLWKQFRSEAPGLSAALGTAVMAADWPSVQAKAHYLKNSADVLGLRELGAACRDLEDAASLRHQPAILAFAEICRSRLQAWC